MALYENEWKEWKKVLRNFRDLKNFHESFREFDECYIDFKQLQIGKVQAILYFMTEFVAIHNDDVIISRFSGEGRCVFHRENDAWNMREVHIPGL
jgi:hypothetical protein